MSIIEYTILGVLLFGVVYAYFTERALPQSLSVVLEAAVAMIALGFGWGIINSIIIKSWPTWRFIYPVLNRALIIFSGIVFVPDFLAPASRYWLSFNPLLHAISLFRLGFYPTEPTLILDTTYLFGCSVAAVAAGLVIERLTLRHE